jgi:hypothetical protein
MSDQTLELDEAIAIALNLSPLDKVRLVEKVMATLEQDLQESSKKPKRSLYGLWEGVNVSEEDIAEVRRDMMKNFPREDI